MNLSPNPPAFRRVDVQFNRLQELAVYLTAPGTEDEDEVRVDVGLHHGEQVVKIARPLLREPCAFSLAMNLREALTKYRHGMTAGSDRELIEAATTVAMLARDLVEWPS